MAAHAHPKMLGGSPLIVIARQAKAATAMTFRAQRRFGIKATAGVIATGAFVFEDAGASAHRAIIILWRVIILVWVAHARLSSVSIIAVPQTRPRYL